MRTPGEREPIGDARKVRRLASSQGLVSYMNNTKWRGVFAGWRNASDPAPRFRVFDLLTPPNHVSPWCRQWIYPRPYVAIKWMEIEVPGDYVLSAVESLKRRNIPVEIVEGGLRIWGWIGSDRPPLA